jgi:hypothetical protein
MSPSAVLLKGGSYVEDPRLDRVPSLTSEHVDKYPITATTLASANSSMMVAINWYENFDAPRRRLINGVWRWVIGEGNLGRVRGGHAVCGRNWKLTDLLSWHHHYNQGSEGRCVEFAKLRILSQMNRKKYDVSSKWHYHTAQHGDEWNGCFLGHDGFAYEGTSGRAGLEVLRAYGAIPALYKTGTTDPSISMEDAPKFVRPEDGIAAYRWATTWDQVRQALNVPAYLPGIPINNSWGNSYPKEVILLDSAGERVLGEWGEFGIVTDK